MANKQTKDGEETNIAPQTSTAVSAMSFEQMLELMKVAVASKGSDPAMMAIAESLKDQADIAKARRREENAVNPRISEFSYPEGDEARPKPTLDSVTIFSNALQDESQLTPIEIELFNKIKGNKTARKGKWTAVYEPPIGDAKRGRLTIALGVNLNDPSGAIGIPPLVQILTELISGRDATDVAKLMQQVADLQTKLNNLASGQAVAVPA